MEVLPWFGTTGFLLMSLSIVLRVICYSDDWFIPFVGDDVVVKCISNLKKNKAAFKYSKRRKFRPKMRQNAFGGRAPPGPAGEA